MAKIATSKLNWLTGCAGPMLTVCCGGTGEPGVTVRFEAVVKVGELPLWPDALALAEMLTV